MNIVHKSDPGIVSKIQGHLVMGIRLKNHYHLGIKKIVKNVMGQSVIRKEKDQDNRHKGDYPLRE